MGTEDIIFIKTDKEGDDLQSIQTNYPNSIIDVNSNKENNLYIGSNRITDHYNLGVDENRITNNVGGMVSGIFASELKGKSISEILDIILFASNNNITLKGVVVVDKIENLTDSTLEDVYQGMVVSVLEDNSLYILLSEDSDSDREWKKVGTDINVEELKNSVKKLSAPITVAGLSGSFGNITNGKTYTTENTIEDILRDLLCKEIYPNVSLLTTNPSLSFGGLNGATAVNYESIMEVGSVLELNPVTLKSASITGCSRRGSGFTYGYSLDNDSNKDGDGNPPIQEGNSSLVGEYTLTETYSQSDMGTVRTTTPSDIVDNVKFSDGSVKICLGDNTIKISATSPSGLYTHPEYPEYYVVSNLGNTNVNNKTSKYDTVNGSIDSITKTSTISVTGVYPVYVNIDSGVLVDEPVKMSLIASNIIEFIDIPSEYAYKKHFTFDYPATHSVEFFEIMNIKGDYVTNNSTYEKELEIPSKVVGGVEIPYKRLRTTGNLKGIVTYRITLSKGLDK